MTRDNRLLLISIIGLMSVFLHSSIGLTQTAQPSIQIFTEPLLQQLVPFEAEATVLPVPPLLTLQATDASGQPLQNAKVHLQILTPAPMPWLTTDFPIVEGTKLLDLEAMAPNGKLQLQQMLPIRGDYQLVVNVAPLSEPQFASFQQTLSLPVRENGLKYRYSGILALILLAAGIGGGWIIGGQQTIRSGEIAPQRVRLLLSAAAMATIVALLAVNLSSASAQHHKDMAETEVISQPTQISYGLELRLSGDKNVTVGQAAKFVAQIRNTATNQPVTNALVNIKVTSLENGWTAFAYQGELDEKGGLTWQEQFFDGAPHQVQVEVQPSPQSSQQFQTLRVTQTIQGEGVSPPLIRKLISLFYFTLILLTGLAIGLWWRRPRQNSIPSAHSN